jgi:Nif-specific regulatory protein
MAEGETITIRELELFPVVPAQPAAKQRTGLRLEDEEKRLIIEALERHGWVQSRAAEALGISRRAMNYKVRKHGLTHGRWRRNV